MSVVIVYYGHVPIIYIFIYTPVVKVQSTCVVIIVDHDLVLEPINVDTIDVIVARIQQVRGHCMLRGNVLYIN